MPRWKKLESEFGELFKEKTRLSFIVCYAPDVFLRRNFKTNSVQFYL